MLAKIQKTLKIDVKVEGKWRKMSKNSDKTPKIGYPVIRTLTLPPYMKKQIKL